MHPVLIWSSQLSLSQGSLTICPGLKKGSLTTDYKKCIVLSVFAFMIIGDSQWVMFILLILVLLFQWKGPAPVACYLLLLQRTLAWNRFEHTDGCIYCLFSFVFSYCVAICLFFVLFFLIVLPGEKMVHPLMYGGAHLFERRFTRSHFSV